VPPSASSVGDRFIRRSPSEALTPVHTPIQTHTPAHTMHTHTYKHTRTHTHTHLAAGRTRLSLVCAAQ
jgi:hypothetical protein